jgi:hypothetical protein
LFDFGKFGIPLDPIAQENSTKPYNVGNSRNAPLKYRKSIITNTAYNPKISPEINTREYPIQLGIDFCCCLLTINQSPKDNITAHRIVTLGTFFLNMNVNSRFLIANGQTAFSKLLPSIRR